MIHPRCDTRFCVRCRKLLGPGDRVATAFIVQQVGRNPTSRELGAFISDEFELVHIDCADPGLAALVVRS